MINDVKESSRQLQEGLEAKRLEQKVEAAARKSRGPSDSEIEAVLKERRERAKRFARK